MSLPMLQVALDNQTMDSAYETTRLIAEEVDIIEVGTILCVGEGVRAVRDLKALYPHKIVLADAKIADAGKILSRMCFEANADWVTVICCADINTAKGALDVAKEFNGDVQIELTGYWTWEQAQQWRDAGIQQVVYHRSRDAQAAGVAWGEADITAIKRLSDMGFKVTVTGGLALEDLPLFKGIPIHVFIAGRSIRDAASPVEAARQFKRSIAELWGSGADMLSKQIPLGIYEKALPAGECWLERLQLAKTLGFDFVEMSVDETDERLSRLDWSREQRLALVNAIVETGVRVPSMCLSAHRRFPLGSEDDAVRAQGLEIMRKAIQFAQDVGIRVIQLAGYDVYYQEANNETRRRFRDGLKESVEMASRAQVTLAMEIMDYPLMNSISKALGYAHYLNNPWFQLYPDIGNLSAWDNDVQMELQAGIGHIVAVHVKDTKPGVFKNVPFGEGVVDFERCFETLKQSGYCGPYLIEMWSETAEDPAAEVAKARDWVKARMAKAGMVEAA
ncbi:hypothetical protein BT08F36_09210 [Escherichia coli]